MLQFRERKLARHKLAYYCGIARAGAQSRHCRHEYLVVIIRKIRSRTYGTPPRVFGIVCFSSRKAFPGHERYICDCDHASARITVSADFLVCGRCGIYVAAVLATDADFTRIARHTRLSLWRARG